MAGMQGKNKNPKQSNIAELERLVKRIGITPEEFADLGWDNTRFAEWQKQGHCPKRALALAAAMAVEIYTVVVSNAHKATLLHKWLQAHGYRYTSMLQGESSEVFSVRAVDANADELVAILELSESTYLKVQLW